MALPPSSLSQACRSVADFLAARLAAAQSHVLVRIGSPAEAAPAAGDTEHRVNLFFYRIEPHAFGPAASPGETWLLRLGCLVTPFGVDDERVSAGENSLRLLGAVLAAFHERPLLDPLVLGDTTVRLQVVPEPLSLDQINHLWMTQGEAPYRASVAYELALVPVPPRTPRPGAPRVGAIGLDVRADPAGRHAPAGRPATPPAVTAHQVDIRREDWAPRIAFVAAGACREFIALTVADAQPPGFKLRVWVAGADGAPVRLAWEIWDPTAGWRPGGTPVAAAASGPSLLPDAAADAGTTPVVLPFNDHPGQAVLYAERTYTRAADGAELKVRSNPLLVDLFRDEP